MHRSVLRVVHASDVCLLGVVLARGGCSPGHAQHGCKLLILCNARLRLTVVDNDSLSRQRTRASAIVACRVTTGCRWHNVDLGKRDSRQLAHISCAHTELA
jgi:hypothetical protein